MILKCPICNTPLAKQSNSAVCENRHSFDYAKGGYLNLLIKQSVDHGDNKAMVQARTAFLNRGPYEFLRQELSDTIKAEHPEVLCDLGCGEGYYTSHFEADEKYGFDMSKEALKHASKTDKSTQYAVASIFHLPLADSSVDTCVTCFAPAACEEIERVLKPGGSFIFVTPGPKHLFELKEELYENPYLNEIKEIDTKLIKEKEWMIKQPFLADHALLTNLFEMTPYAHRTGQRGKDKLNSLESLTINAEFVIRLYRKA